MEMKRLREGNGCMLPCPGLLGSLVAADIRLPLKPEFMAKLGTAHGLFSLPCLSCRMSNFSGILFTCNLLAIIASHCSCLE